VRRLEFTTLINAPASQVWDFFSSPGNLSLLTPASMNFVIKTPDTGRAYPGMFIGYRVSPLPGMRVSWLTEITHLSEGKYFIDEQRQGPYSLWHHEHHFREVEGGIEMQDLLYYRVPFGFIGRLLDSLLIRKRVLDIFTYRDQKIREFFPAGK